MQIVIPNAKIVTPYARMLSPQLGYDSIDRNGSPCVIRSTDFTPQDGIAMLRRIEYAARVSHRSEEAITWDSYDRILRSVVLQHGDMSVIEHATVTVEAVVDRGITHEWVRHRLFSYTQESTRFVNYVKKMLPSFIVPKFTAEQETNNARYIWETAIQHLENAYVQLITAGCAPQLARSVFPNALAAKIIVTGNLRSWRHFFIMRCSKNTHPQMLEVSLPLLAEFQRNIPILFEDIVPMRQQSESMTLLR